MKNQQATLRHPINFSIANIDRWADLLDDPSTLPPHPGSCHWRYINMEDAGVVQTYAILRNQGYPVTVSIRPVPNSINIVSGVDFAAKRARPDAFTVGIRGDGPRPAICDAVIAHNMDVLKPEDVYMPLWIQTGLEPREETRQDLVEVLEYKGAIRNLDEQFRSESFKSELSNIGVQLRVAGKEDGPANRWHDYNTTDLVIAARDITVGDAAVKPAVKLVNAWAAGAPALLGPEPAYRQLRSSVLDYFEIETAAEALSAVRVLKSQPALYREMRLHGLERARAFSEESTTTRWIDAFNGSIAHSFEQWKATSLAKRKALLAVRYLLRRKEEAEAKKLRFSGPRLLSNCVSRHSDYV